jgi:hypothetical protein
VGFHRLDRGRGQPKLLPLNRATVPRPNPTALFHLSNDIGKFEYTYGWYLASGGKQCHVG